MIYPATVASELTASQTYAVCRQRAVVQAVRARERARELSKATSTVGGYAKLLVQKLQVLK